MITCTHTHIYVPTEISIHPSIVPWVHHPLVSNANLTIFSTHLSVLCLPFRMYISSLHHSFTSSSHSLFVFPSISLSTTSFTSLLSSILKMCQDKFNFLSMILLYDVSLATHSYFFVSYINAYHTKQENRGNSLLTRCDLFFFHGFRFYFCQLTRWNQSNGWNGRWNSGWNRGWNSYWGWISFTFVRRNSHPPLKNKSLM